MSNCNDDYEQIRKKLSECNRDVKYIFVQGLAGPTGGGRLKDKPKISKSVKKPYNTKNF